MTRFPRMIVPLMLASLLLPLAAYGADPESTVSGVGMSTVEKRAEILRLQVQLQVEGANLKDALDKLKSKREQVKTGLVKLGADEKTFETGEPAVSDGAGGNDRRAAMERAMRDRMGGRGGAASQAAKTVMVTSTIKAEWNLKSDAPEAMIIAAEDVKEKVKGSKLLEVQKSAAAEEADAEAAAMAQMNQGPSPNEPLYFYVARITDAENAKASSEAFAKAKDAATRLAKSAGVELGALRSISGQSGPDSESMSAMQEYGGSSYYYRQIMMQRYGGGGDSKEAVSMQPGKVTLQVMVQAAFTIK